MNKMFKCELNGKELFKKMFLFIIPFVIAHSVLMVAAIVSEGKESSLYSILVMPIFIICSLFFIALFYQFVSQIINSVSIDDEKFSFEGSLWEFIVINIKGIVLSGLTAYIYTPWYYEEVIKYFAENTNHGDKLITFDGKPGKLLKYIVLACVVPLIVLGIVLIPIIIALENNEGSQAGLAIFLLLLLAFVYIFIISITWVLQIKWLINFTYGKERLTLDFNMLNASFYIIGQLLLCCLTLGIYIPAAYISIFKYFLSKAKFIDPEDDSEKLLIFKGETCSGYGNILGHGLLSCLTFGIYTPWALAKVFNWLISNIEIEDFIENSEDLYRA